jgi:hypothetical protein
MQKVVRYGFAFLCLTGCAETTPRVQVVRVQSDNYCRLATPLTYDAQNDSLKTIDRIRTAEQTRRCLCVKPTPKDCGQFKPTS